MGRPRRLAGLSPFLPSFLYFLNQNFREKKEVLEVEYFRKEKYPWSLENMQNLNKLVWQFLEEEK